MNPKNIVYAIAAAASFLVGAIDQYKWPGGEETPVDIASLLLFAFLIFYWFRTDASERKFPRSSGLTIAVVGLAAVALPYYLFRSRGAKGGFVALGFFVLVIVASGLLTIAGQYATYFGLQA